MKIRPDIVQVYREVHSWVGILCGLFLFVAFYAGSISMFEQPLQNWLTPESTLPKPVSLDAVPELLQKAFAGDPDAGAHYTVVINPDHTHPARLMWPLDPTHRGHGPQDYVLAALSPSGELVTTTSRPSEIPFFIDQLHEQVGLPLPHAIARYVMGCVALAYSLALVSGVVSFLPALKKMLFAVRLDTGARKGWLDLHTLLGFFSLPFHCIIALTALVFAFHEPVFTVQGKLFQPSGGADQGATHRHGPPTGREKGRSGPPVNATEQMPPQALLSALQRQAPGFEVESLEYTTQQIKGKSRTTLRVSGHDDRYPMRGATNGFAMVDPVSGKVLSTESLPGQQSTGFAALTAFVSLHFGSYGGLPVRWGYYCLGLGGAFLFYTGNRLWILARQRREQNNPSAASRQTRGTWILSCLTTGCTAGCMTGIALLFTCAQFLPLGGNYSQATTLYYVAFLLCVGLAFALTERVREPLLYCVAGLADMGVATVLLVPMLWGSGSMAALCVGIIALVLGSCLLWSVRRSVCRLST